MKEENYIKKKTTKTHKFGIWDINMGDQWPFPHSHYSLGGEIHCGVFGEHAHSDDPIFQSQVNFFFNNIFFSLISFIILLSLLFFFSSKYNLSWKKVFEFYQLTCDIKFNQLNLLGLDCNIPIIKFVYSCFKVILKGPKSIFFFKNWWESYFRSI